MSVRFAIASLLKTKPIWTGKLAADAEPGMPALCRASPRFPAALISIKQSKNVIITGITTNSSAPTKNTENPSALPAEDAKNTARQKSTLKNILSG